MNIVYVGKKALPDKAANTVNVVQMVDALAGQGHEVSLMVPYAKGKNCFEDVKTFYGLKQRFRLLVFSPAKWLRRFWEVAFALNVQHAIRNIRPDVVVSRGLVVSVMLGRKGVPVVFDAHREFWNNVYERWMLRRLIVCKSVCITTNSEALRERFIQRLGDAWKERILALPNGALDASRVLPASLGDDQPTPLVVGYFGHLYQGRGVDLIVDVAKCLPDARFHFFGGEPEHVAYWRERCKEQKNCVFHGHVDYAQVAAYRQACDVLVAPYGKSVAVAGGVGDTSAIMSPIKLFEYMASRKAIVTSDLPAIRAVVNDNSVVLCEPESVDQWAAAINFLRDVERREEFATRAYETFLTQYTWDSRARRLVKFAQEVLEK